MRSCGADAGGASANTTRPETLIPGCVTTTTSSRSAATVMGNSAFSGRPVEPTGLDHASTAHGQRVLAGFDRRNCKAARGVAGEPLGVRADRAGAAQDPVRGGERHSLRVEQHAGDTESPRAHRRDVDTHRVAPRRQLNPLRRRFDEGGRMERGEERHQLLLAERHAHAGLLRARHGDAAALDSHDVLPRFQAVNPIPPEVIGRGWLVADALRHIGARHHARGDHVHAGKWFTRFVHDAPLDRDAGRQRKSEVPDVFAGADRERAPGIVRPARAMSGRKVTALVERGRHDQAISAGRDARETEAPGGIRHHCAPVDSCPFEVLPRGVALHQGSRHEQDHGSLDRGPGPGRLDAARDRYRTRRGLVASRRLVAQLSLRKQGTEQGEEDSPQVAHSGQRQSRNSSVRRSSSPMTNGVASLLSRSKNASPGFTTGRNPSRATAIA